MLSTIGNVEDFEDADKLAAYLGIVPRVHNSSDTVRHGRITKMGNKIARTALVQSTLITIRYNGYLRSFYEKIKRQEKVAGKQLLLRQESC